MAFNLFFKNRETSNFIFFFLNYVYDTYCLLHILHLENVMSRFMNFINYIVLYNLSIMFCSLFTIAYSTLVSIISKTCTRINIPLFMWTSLSSLLLIPVVLTMGLLVNMLSNVSFAFHKQLYSIVRAANFERCTRYQTYHSREMWR